MKCSNNLTVEPFRIIRPSMFTKNILMNFRRNLLFVLLFLMLIPAYWIGISAPGAGIYHDDGIYIVTAKALAEGKGYRIISLPEELAQTKYPVLFPALLALVWKVFPKFPENLNALKSIPLMATLFWSYLLYRYYFKKTNDFKTSFALIWIILASPWILFFSGVVLSETLFSLLCAGSLVCLDKVEDNDDIKTKKIVLLASVLAASAFLTRFAGIPLLFAGGLSLFIRRRYRSCVMFVAIYIVIILPWFIWQTMNSVITSPDNSYYTLSSYAKWNVLFSYPALFKIRVVAKNLFQLFFIQPAMLGMNFIGLCHISIQFFVVIIVNSFFVFGFLKDLQNGMKSIHLFLLFYYGMVLVWVWPPIRFVVPVYPLWAYYSYNGYRVILSLLFNSIKKVKVINGAIFVVLCFSLGVSLYYSSIKTLHTHQISISWPYEQDSIEYDWAEMESLFHWIRKNTPADSVLLANLDPTIYLYTGRKAVRGFKTDPFLLLYSEESDKSLGNEKDFIDILKKYKVNYILRTPEMGFSEVPIYNKIMDNVIDREKEVFLCVKKGNIPEYRIYEVKQDRLLEYMERMGN